MNRADLARQELAQRHLAQTHILPFAKRFYPNYMAGWAHKVLAARLEKFLQDVVDKKSPRLMIFMPPQTGKSMLTSDVFPSWALGKYPHLRFILTSYSISLPIKFSRYVRERYRSPAFQSVFPEAKIHPEIQAAEHWETTEGGGFRAVGVGGSITGHGAEVIVVDDPFKDWDEANSEVIRETVHNWYPTTLRTRLQPGGGIININTRWHFDDLSGRQLRMDKENREAGLEEDELENWEILSLPALAKHDEYVTRSYHITPDPEPGSLLVRKEGEALHPERHTRKEWLRRKAGSTAQQFSALYQQDPVPDSGDLFTKDDFVYYTEVPEMHHYPVYFAWDLAIGEKKKNDWTVGFAGILVPRGELNHLYILDMFRKRVRDIPMYQAIVQMYLKYKSNAAKIGIEYGQLFLAVEKAVLREFRKHNITPGWDRNLKPVQDKVVRSQPARAWMQHHRVHFPRNADWVDTARTELLQFDAGVHDDIVDALSWLVRMVNDVPKLQSATERSARDAWGNKTTQQRINDYARQQKAQGTGRGFMTA